MQVDAWSVYSPEECERMASVVVWSDETPKDLRNARQCEGTLFDSRMGPRFEGDVCGTCGGTYETCKLGHFGIIRLNEYVFMNQYVPHIVRAMRGVCRVCFGPWNKDQPCRWGQGLCITHDSVTSNKSGGITVDNEPWNANRVFAFLSKVSPDDWPRVKTWRSKVLPHWCLFDRVLVLSNSHRPSNVSRTDKSVKLAHRHTTAFQKLLRIVDRRSRMTVQELRLSVQELHSALNDLFMRKGADGKAADREGILASMTRKEGLIRNNLLGKRVDFAARAVVVGNPSLRVDEFGIPSLWKSKLTYPELVWEGNLVRMRNLIRAGEWSTIIKKDTGRRYDADFAGGDSRALASRLCVGDVVHRWLRDDDLVILIRQPTLHKGSMMCGKVRLHDRYTIEMNVNATTPFNGDFDGDEYNAFVPQSLESRVEYEELFALQHQIVNENGHCQMYPMQNAALGAYLMTKPPPEFRCDCGVEYGGIVPHVNSRFVTKKHMQRAVLDAWHDQSPRVAVDYIQDMSDAAYKWLDEHGVSVGLNEFDCVRTDPIRESDGALLRAEKMRVQKLLDDLRNESKDGFLMYNLAKKHMLEMEDTIDTSLRDMYRSGCKGTIDNELNVALVIGQQMVGDAAPRPFLGNRVLPCDAEIKRSFIPVGYVQGLRPEHTALHQMSGRYGVYVKSVGVKESGQRFRQLGQCLESLVVRPGGTVCDADGNVVQLLYGEDGFDPKHVRDGLPVRSWDAYAPDDMEEIPDVVRNMHEAASEAELGKAAAYFLGKTHAPAKLLRDWYRGTMPYGQAVGVIAAQSISEPATQQTLDAFHFPGTAHTKKVNLRRLFGASAGEIYAPLVGDIPPVVESWKRVEKCPEDTDWTVRFERFVEFPHDAASYLVMEFSRETSVLSILRRIKQPFRSSHPALDKGNIVVHVAILFGNDCDVLHAFRETEKPSHRKCTAQVCRYGTWMRDVVVEDDALTCRGDFKQVLSSSFVDFTRTYTDDAKAIAAVLGIEAARAMLLREFTKAFEDKVDVRHVMLMVDAMTYKGEVRAMNVHGYKKLYESSVMGTACFEQALLRMFRASVDDQVEGSRANVSSAVLTGNMCALGTGAVHVELDEDLARAYRSEWAYDPTQAYDPVDTRMREEYDPTKGDYEPTWSGPGMSFMRADAILNSIERAESSEYRPSSPVYHPSSPDYPPTEYRPSSPDYAPSEYRPSSPDYAPSEYRPSTPVEMPDLKRMKTE